MWRAAVDCGCSLLSRGRSWTSKLCAVCAELRILGLTALSGKHLYNLKTATYEIGLLNLGVSNGPE